MTRDLQTNNRPSTDACRGAARSAPDAVPRRPSTVDRVVEEAASGHCDRALRVAQEHGADDLLTANAVGVCLLRLGRTSEAVGHFHSLLFSPGCATMRQDRPIYLKLNYATALLLSGQPDACLGVLQATDDQSPTAKRLRDAIERWETALTFGQKLDWWINHVAPSGVGVSIDFVPGDFGLAETSAPAPPNSVLRPQPPNLPADSVQPSAPT